MKAMKVNTNFSVNQKTLNVFNTERDAIIYLQDELYKIQGCHSFYSIKVNSGSEKYFIPEGFEIVGQGCHSTTFNDKGNPVNKTHNLYALVKITR